MVGPILIQYGNQVSNLQATLPNFVTIFWIFTKWKSTTGIDSTKSRSRLKRRRFVITWYSNANGASVDMIANITSLSVVYVSKIERERRGDNCSVRCNNEFFEKQLTKQRRVEALMSVKTLYGMEVDVQASGVKHNGVIMPNRASRWSKEMDIKGHPSQKLSHKFPVYEYWLKTTR